MATTQINPDKPVQDELVCKLTSSELQQRKETVIAKLKSQVLTSQELENGYAYQFLGTDETIDDLVSFVKTERQCCGFFSFDISVDSTSEMVWLKIKGPEGTRDFIRSELEW